MTGLTDLLRRHRRLSAVHIEQWIARGLLRPSAPDLPVSEIEFAPLDTARIQLLYDLSEDLTFDDDALETVVSLIDQIHALRHELTTLSRAVSMQSADVQRSIAQAVRMQTRN